MNLKKRPGQHEQTFYGRGKLLLSGEYFVLDGASALALPMKLGQSMTVRYSPSFNPLLYWKSFDANSELWFESKFEFWHFDCMNSSSDQTVIFLQNILREARKQNQHFLRDDVDVYVETNLEFPLDWGLGSSSTLIYNIAQWAYVSPFKLLFNIYNGSGYDIAAAQSDCPIIYEKADDGPKWSLSKFDPSFKQNIYFVYMGNKVDSNTAIEAYKSKKLSGQNDEQRIVQEISVITREMEECDSLKKFNSLIRDHEEIISKSLDIPRIRDTHFTDYWGEIKSLGAWGGDFILATSKKSEEETKEYFMSKGYHVILPYQDIVFDNRQKTVTPHLREVDIHKASLFIQ